MADVPFLGCKISLISKCDIRYEGILYSVDAKESTIALSKVKSYGTETRGDPSCFVAPKNDIYDIIIFRASDVKDLRVDAQQPPGLSDPAIISVNNHKYTGQSPSTSSFINPSSSSNNSTNNATNPGAPTLNSNGSLLTSSLINPSSNNSTNNANRERVRRDERPRDDRRDDRRDERQDDRRDDRRGDRPIDRRGDRRHDRQDDRRHGDRRDDRQGRDDRQDDRRDDRRGGSRDRRDVGRRDGRSNTRMSRGNNRNHVNTNTRYNNHTSSNNYNHRGSNRDNNSKGDAPNYRRGPPPVGRRGRSGDRTGAPRGTRKTAPLKFEGEYDFEKANKIFLDLEGKLKNMKLKDDKEGPESSGDRDNSKSPAVQSESGSGYDTEDQIKDGDSKDGEGSVSGDFYDRSKSFFDNISCEASERSQGKVNRPNWRKERELNTETFGVAGHYRRGGYRGRGYGAGGYNRR